MILRFLMLTVETVLLGLGLKAQENIHVFSNINVSNGLSNNSVTSLLQDRYGFMWMGTYDGLNRFDGYGFRVFRNRWMDSTSLVNNHITALAEKDSNSIWVGTQKGLSLFDYRTSQFRKVSYQREGNYQPVEISARIRAVLNDKNGNTFVATKDRGLLVLIKGMAQFRQLTFGKDLYNVSAICLYNEEILLYVRGGGVYLFNPRNFSRTLVTGTIGDATSLLYQPALNSLLVGTENGLLSLNLSTKEITRPYTIFAKSNITNLLYDRAGNLWISTDGEGLGEVPAHTGDVVMTKETAVIPGLRSNAVFAVYEDDQQRKWVATLRGGVTLMSTPGGHFITIKKEPFSKNTLPNNFVRSFCQEDENNIWIGTDGGGLSRWNIETNKFINFSHQPGNPNTLSGNYVVSILKDHKGRLWVASFSGGIDLFNVDTKSFRRYPCYDSVRHKEVFNLWQLYEDSHHRIWAGSTKDDALFLLNEKEDRFKLFDESLTNIHVMYEDSKGNLWAGDYSHLIRIDPSTHKHAFLNVGYPIRAITEDRQGRLWLGTEGGGLVYYDQLNHTFIHYTEADGLPNNSVLNILHDDSGNLWCSTYNGLSRFSPSNGSFVNYSINDGLQSNQFNYNAALRLKDGELLFGGVDGFSKFYPEAINRTVRHPPLLITDFRISDIPIEKTRLLPRDATPVNVSSVTIPFNRATISISFAGLDYEAPGSLLYSYYLDGWDKRWNMSGTNRVASYSRLYEGSYTLHIRTTNVDGNWSGSERMIHILVLPPWYRTWWAYLLYSLVFGAFLYFYLSYKQKQTRLRYEVKLTRLNAETERALTERKISFFTDISHEFRTMLTLIINPMRELMKSADESDKPDEIRSAYKNSRRMLSLVTQLLMFRKAEVDEMEMAVSRIDLVSISKEIFDSFEYQAKSKRLEYRFVCDAESSMIYGDAEKIEIMLFNLLSNAIKYAPEKGAVTLVVEDQHEQVDLSISDNGPGIPREEQDRIFEKYHQANSSGTSLRPGFGIGLFLVKHFVEAHHGTIRLYSSQEKGTIFHVNLLKGCTHFEGIPIRESKGAQYRLIDDIFSDEESASEEQEMLPGPVPEDLLSMDKTILLADDNPEIRMYVRNIFVAEGYKIIETDNGTTALELIRAKRPDLAILDLAMPGIFGDELCMRVKSEEATRHIPVIILTAEISTEIKLRCVESGADDYITKPFEKELLTARVGNLLKTKSNLQHYFYNEITLQQNFQHISGPDRSFLEKCIAVVEDHLDDDQFEVQTLADELCMSHSNLYKKIHSISGYSANGFVRFVRLRKAAELFVSSSYNVGETAFLTGFRDAKYFRVQFQKLFGMTPSAYIKKYRKVLGNAKKVK